MENKNLLIFSQKNYKIPQLSSYLGRAVLILRNDRFSVLKKVSLGFVEPFERLSTSDSPAVGVFYIRWIYTFRRML